jgi:hypothetical protein
MRSHRITVKSWLGAGLLALGVGSSTAGTASHDFQVQVRLTPASTGLCISQSLSQQTNATVTVTCRDREFVSIEATARRAYGFTHGGAYRFVMPSGYFSIGQLWRDHPQGVGIGTVTALRVMQLQDVDDRLELLVSF